MPFVPAPLEHEPLRVVENIHELPNTDGSPDLASQVEMELFLEERIQGDQSGLRRRFGRDRVYDPVERTRLGWNRWAYAHIARDPRDRLVTDGRSWRRATAAGFLAVNVIVNLVNGNIVDNVKNAIDDVAEEVSEIKDGVQDGFRLYGNTICETPGPSATVTVTGTRETESFYFSSNKVGESNPEVSITNQILDKVEAAKADGAVTSMEIEIETNASDEWFGLGVEGNYGYGQDEDGNEELAATRLADEKQLLLDEASRRGIDLSGIDISFTHKQNTLDEATLVNLQSLVESFGYGSVGEVHSIHNADPDSLPFDVLREFDRYFPRNRDTVRRIAVTKETKTTITVDASPGEQDGCVLIDGEPEDENHDYDWQLVPFLWPALPLFMRKRITKMKGSPIDLGDLENPQRLLIHRDGVQPNSELDKSAWAYVRKFMYLFREDDRMTKIFEHRYRDEDDREQSLRAIFVDHEPTQESVDMVARIFEFSGQIQGGRLGRECDVVVIYPRGHAGLHGNPKHVGLGMDVQHRGSIIGVAIPSLGIVEMHMPEVPTAGELDEDYDSTAWVLAHELDGHFSDLNDEPNQLIQAGQNANGREVYRLPNRFANSSMTQYRRGDREQDRANFEAGGRIRRFFGRMRGAESMRWLVDRGRGTLPWPGMAEPTLQTISGTDDVRLTEALRVSKETGNPTIYGSSLDHRSERTAALEAHAEAAANKVTGIPIPFAEAPEYAARGIRPEDPNRFTGGYDVSTGWHETLDSRWGTVTEDGTTIFPNRDPDQSRGVGRLDDPENFPWARELAAWARSVEVPEPGRDDWVEIIVGQALRQQLAAERAKRKILV